VSDLDPVPQLDAATLRAWDAAHTWHPFTPHDVYADEAPLMVVAAEGLDLIDADGRRYLDACGSLWCNVLGHRHPRLDAAVRSQLGRVAHATWLGNSSAPGVVLARRLLERAPPDLSRVFYSDNGSTATEIAMKMAYQYFQQAGLPGGAARTRFLAFGLGYQGDTLGAVSVGGVQVFHDRFRHLLFDVVRVPSPYAARLDAAGGRRGGDAWLRAALAPLDEALSEHGAELAAIVLEPGMQGAGGMLTQPPGFVAAVRERCDAHGVLLILDEVAMGMGRSGDLFASLTEGVTPDLLCIAKGLGGGYLPIAATLTTEALFDAFRGPPEAGRTFFHGHTYTGNALGCAVGLAVLDAYEQDGVLAGLPERAAALARMLERVAAHPGVGGTRRYGLAAGVDIVDPSTGQPRPGADRFAAKVCVAARDQGVFLRPLGETIPLMPPLTISIAELDRLGDAIVAAIDAAAAMPRRG
jgi:adenosylmethionine-8-amino-7-oxononanoate aminotransferase